MADLSKFKKRLAPPPTPDQVPENLRSPETAPAPVAAVESMGRVGGRRRRSKTNRTIQFATRVTEEFDLRFRDIAERDGLLLAQLLEKALEAYEKK